MVVSSSGTNINDLPNFLMYSILKNNIVINFGFKNNDVFISAMDNKTEYTEKEGYTFIPMTLENSPSEIGMSYNGKNFYFKEIVNA